MVVLDVEDSFENDDIIQDMISEEIFADLTDESIIEKIEETVEDIEILDLESEIEFVMNN
jgi:hypothetical protein